MKPIKTTAKLRALAFIIAGIVYIIIPTDLSPDFMPFIGWIDDVIVSVIAASLAFRALKRKVRGDSGEPGPR